MERIFMKFIVLEGLDGSGKTTQAARLKERFISENIPIFSTNQPSNSELGKLARSVTQGKFKLENESLSLLFSAEHYQHLKEAIIPALARGEYVLCDRFYYSNVAYQGIDSATIERIVGYIRAVMETRRPDLTLFLDVYPEECINRISKRRDEISIYESLAQLKEQRERYFSVFNRLKEKDNVVVINANDISEDELTDKLWSQIFYSGM